MFLLVSMEVAEEEYRCLHLFCVKWDSMNRLVYLVCTYEHPWGLEIISVGRI